MIALAREADAPSIADWIERALAVYWSGMKDSTETNWDARDRRDIARVLEGDGDAFERLIQRHQGTISRQMWRFTRNEREHAELVHDVFVQAFMSLRSYRAKGPFIHWLRKIAVRVGYGFWRRRERRKRTVSAEAAPLMMDRLQSDPSETGAAEAAEVVHYVLRELPPRDRLVLTMQYIEERSVSEIAALTGWSAAMVKVQAWRARAKFRKLMEHLEETGGN